MLFVFVRVRVYCFSPGELIAQTSGNEHLVINVTLCVPDIHLRTDKIPEFQVSPGEDS
jgi:hypothetical protein